MRFTLEQAIARCAFWQTVLRLQDWDVTVQFGRYHEMHSRSSVGQVWVANGARRAIITLLDPVDFKPSEDLRTLDMDDTIVHELLHLHFSDLRVPKSGDDAPMTYEEVAEERAIDALASAFVQIDRRCVGGR